MSVDTLESITDLECTTVDADFHCTEQLSDIVEYMESPWREFLSSGHDPYSDDDGDGYVDPFPDAALLATHVVTGRAQIFSADAVRNPDDVREGLDTLSIDRPIITPGGAMLSLGLVQNDQVATALARATNEWLLDTIVDEDQNAYGTITVAGQRPDEAAEEIDDRADESGMVGVYFPTAGVNPPLGDRRYDPLYEACEDAGLPLLMHGVAGGMMKSFPVQYDGLERAMPTHVLGHPFQHMVNVASMVTQGVPVRYPDVDFVFQEAGIGWIPFLMYRMNNEWYAQRQDAPLLERPPSEYMRENFYYTTQPLEGTQDAPDYVTRAARSMGAEDCLMFSSDYPHHDFDHTDEVFRVFAREFDHDELASIFGDTATDVFFS